MMQDMDSTAEQQGAAGKLTSWLSLAYSLLAVCALVWILAGRPPLRRALMLLVMRLSQSLAFLFGQVGLVAENDYRRIVEQEPLA